MSTRIQQNPTVDSYDRIRREVPPPPEWVATSDFRWEVGPAEPGDPPGYAFVYRWSTPVFDLRPDLSSQIGTTKQGVPIWRRYARLRVLITGPQGANLDGTDLSVTATESVSVFDANVQTNVATGQSASPSLFQLDSADVTNVFFPVVPLTPGQSQAALGEFSFRGNQLGGGEGYPIRYYRVSFLFRKVVETGLPVPPNPPFPADIALSAGVY